MRSRLIAVVAVILLVIAGAGYGAERTLDKKQAFNKNHQAGIRLGAWSNRGETPSTSGSSDGVAYKADIKDANVYAEGFLGIRVFPQAMIEIAFGVSNRGDVTVVDSAYGSKDIGSVTVYPMHVRVKCYPLGGMALSMQPFVMAGAGLYYGRYAIQFSNDSWAEWRENSQTQFNLVYGGGVDWPLSTKIGVEAQCSLMPVNFSKGLFTTRKYDALTITVGVKYFITSLRSNQETHR